MTVSAFGVEHDRDDIYKALRMPGGGKGAKADRAREMLGRAMDTARTATGHAIQNPSNKNVTLREAPKVIADQAATDSPYGAAYQAGKKVVGRRNEAKREAELASRANAWLKEFPKRKDKRLYEVPRTGLLDNTTLGDIAHGASVNRVETKPENLFRGKKTTTTTSNAITGRSIQRVEREGNAFFKPKHVVRENGGEAQVVDDKAGGLTGKGKVAFVGGPGAAAGLGGIALNERSKRNAYGY